MVNMHNEAPSDYGRSTSCAPSSSCGWRNSRRQSGCPLRKAVGYRCHLNPRVHRLFENRERWPRQLRIGKAAHRDPIAVRVSVSIEKNIAAAVRTEMETGLTPAGGITLINFAF